MVEETEAGFSTSLDASADPTLVVQLEGPEAVVLEGPEVHRDGVGGATDHLALHQESLVG